MYTAFFSLQKNIGKDISVATKYHSLVLYFKNTYKKTKQGHFNIDKNLKK